MKRHEEKTFLFWQRVMASHPNLTQGDYEEWRANPVTARLFDYLEYSLLSKQTELAELYPGDPNIPVKQAGVHAYMVVTADLFSWAPEGIALEDDEDED